MKFIRFYAFLLLFCIGCQSDHKLSFEPHNFESDICDNCPTIAIAIPKALGEAKISKTINFELEEELIYLLAYDKEMEVTTRDEAVQSFKKGYLELQQLYSHETTPWEAEIKGKILYEDAHFITIALDAFLFTGGAHGYASKQLLNFDKDKGVRISYLELFKDLDGFRTYAEKMFREKEKIPSDKPINYTGLMFEDETFYLPENMGFTKDGLQLLYNPYEVSSYAEGAIEIILPHSEVRKYLSKKTKS